MVSDFDLKPDLNSLTNTSTEKRTGFCALNFDNQRLVILGGKLGDNFTKAVTILIPFPEDLDDSQQYYIPDLPVTRKDSCLFDRLKTKKQKVLNYRFFEKKSYISDLLFLSFIVH